MARKLVLASNNAGKLREFSSLLAPRGFELVPQGSLGVPEAEEPHATFIENALAKARHASQLTGLPALADDSGVCVTALGGEPGVYSARYAARNGGENPTPPTMRWWSSACGARKTAGPITTPRWCWCVRRTTPSP